MKKTFDSIRNIAAGSGASKQAILKQADSIELREVLVYALDPFRTYGVKNISVPPAATNPTIEWADWRTVLNQLAERKLTGNAARDLISQMLSKSAPSTQEVIIRILTKDLSCGIHTTTVNKVFKDLIPTFGVQLAKPREDRKLKFPCYVETKHDGKRIVAIARIGEPVRMYSRNGHEEHGYQHIKFQMAEIVEQTGRELLFDGELMFGMFGDRKAKEHEVEFQLFDMLTYSEWAVKKCTLTYVERMDRIAKLCEVLNYSFGEHINWEPGQVVNTADQIEVIYRGVVDNGGEGVMIKDPKGLYEFKRTFAWMKMKPEESEDLEVVDVFEGEGKYQGMLGGVVVKFKGVEVRVGSGFSDWQRKMYWTDFSLIGKTVEVLYTEVTPDGSLRFPRFKCVRDDK